MQSKVAIFALFGGLSVQFGGLSVQFGVVIVVRSTIRTHCLFIAHKISTRL